MKKTALLAFSILAVSTLGPTPARAEEANLEDQLNALNVPANEAPASVTDEKLYSVQSRYAPLYLKSELSIGAARNFTADSFVDSNQLNAGYRFHISDRWSVGVSGSYVFNSYSPAGDRLLSMQGLLPDAAYVKYRGDLTVGFNLFYGKFRLTMDRVFYFDQYWTLGPALIEMDTGRAYGATADAGLVLWLGRRGNIRIGIKDYLYRQQRVTSSSVANDLTGHIDLGLLLGGGST
jgi:outer membrane beta-barrel protein